MVADPRLISTFTLIGRCASTGAMGIVLASSPMAVGARCPMIRPGVGAVSSQAFVHPGLRARALDLLELGMPPARVLRELAAGDSHSACRQIAILRTDGTSAAVSGEAVLDHKGTRTGENYAAIGNNLQGPEVLDAIEAAWHGSAGAEWLEDRLVRAITAGREAGGEKAGQLSAALLVCGADPWPRTDLRIDRHDGPPGTDSVDGLCALYDAYRPLIPYYLERVDNPSLPPWGAWLEQQV